MARDAEALLLQMSADIRGLEKSFAKARGVVDGGSKAMERRAQQASTNLEKYFGKTDVAKAFDKVFDSSRIRVFDTATARIGITGSALESLGPAGLAAAAGVGALAAAFVGARAAAKFADDIADTANRLHVTTDALQEYRYAVRAAGGEEAGADEALEAFSANLGKAQEGLKKSQRAFLALGFTKAQIQGFTDADAALRAVAERIKGLPSQQRDAIIEQLGLDGLKPALDGGIAKLEALRQEAHKVGIVMDADLVKRGGDLNDQFETVTKVIDVQLKSALVDLGPILLGLLGFMAQLAKAAADVVDAFRSIENKRTQFLKDDVEILSDKGPKGFIARGLAAAQGDPNRLQREQAELAKRAAEDKPPPIKPTRTLIDTTKAPAGPHDDTAQRNESLTQALAAAIRDRLQAELRLTGNIEERAALERRIAAEELVQTLSRLAKERADLADDKGFKGDRAAANAKLDQAEVEVRKAAEAKADLLNREADWDAEDAADEVRQRLRDLEIEQLQSQADLTTSAKDRTAIEAEINKLRTLELIHERNKALSRGVQTGALSQADADAQQQASERQIAAGDAAFDKAHQGPIQRYIDSLKDVDTQMQELAVSAAVDLSNGLADAIVNARSLGDVAKNVFRQLLAQLLASAIQKDIAAPLLSAFLPHHAAGTNFAPGGLSLVGERGPELVNLPRGSQVLPHNQTLAALQRLKLPAAGAQVSIVQPFHFHAEGAVLTADLLAQADARARGHANAAALAALRQANRSLPSRQRAYGLLGTT